MESIVRDGWSYGEWTGGGAAFSGPHGYAISFLLALPPTGARAWSVAAFDKEPLWATLNENK